MWRDFKSSFGCWGLTAREGKTTTPDGPTNITLSNDTITVDKTIVGALGMVAGTPPPTFTVTSVTGA